MGSVKWEAAVFEAGGSGMYKGSGQKSEDFKDPKYTSYLGIVGLQKPSNSVQSLRLIIEHLESILASMSLGLSAVMSRDYQIDQLHRILLAL